MGSLALDSVIKFAQDEELWLHYFHKGWYLSTTAGGRTLKRMEKSEKVIGDPKNSRHDFERDINTECFSWGCEQFRNRHRAKIEGTEPQEFVERDIYFNTHGSDWRQDAFGTCAYKYEKLIEGLQCKESEKQTPEKIRIHAEGEDPSKVKESDPNTAKGIDTKSVSTKPGQSTEAKPVFVHVQDSNSAMIQIQIQILLSFFLLV